MKKELATLIKTRRLQLGLTQKEVAEGICAQPVISSLESGQASPSVELFGKLIRKLNISSNTVAELFHIPVAGGNEFYTPTLQNMLYSRNYAGIMYILKSVPLDSLSPLQQQYYLWIEYSMIYFVQHRITESIERLLHLSTEVDQYSDLYLKIYNSIASIYVEENDFDNALIYYQEIVPFEKNMTDTEMFSKILYNISRIYYFKKDFKTASVFCTRAIDYLIATHRLSLLGDCYLMHSVILEEIGNLPEAVISCERAICLFAIENNYTQKIISQKQLSELTVRREKL